MSILHNIFKLLSYVIVISCFITSVSANSSDWDISETSKVRLISPFSQNNVKDFIVGLEYEMEQGWKTYWKSPGDGGFAQSISWDYSSNVKNVSILWPTPVEFEILGLKSLGYQNNVIFPLEIELEDASQDTFLNLQVSFLICKDICIPGDAKVFLDIPSGEKKLNDNYFNLERALSFLPEKDFNSSYIKKINADVFTNNKFSRMQIKFESDKSFYNPKIFLHTPFGLPVLKNSFTYSSDNKLLTANFNFDKDLISEQNFPLEIIIKDNNHNFKKIFNVQTKEELSNLEINKSYLYYLFISLLAGLILNIMPCVFPILSIKLMSILSSDNYNARTSFLTTAFGIISSFVLLGLVFLFLQYFKISIAWGMQFQQPYFLVFITLVIFLFMMNMFGQFEINLPNQLSSIGFIGSKKPYLKDFFNGFFVTLMATPCSADFVGTAITAAFTQSYVIGVSIFLFMGMGMSLPYLLIAMFPKLVNFIPKPGKWMIYVKYFLGLMLLATVFWLSNILLNFYNYYFILLSFLLFVVLSYRQKLFFFKKTITSLVLLVLFFSSSLKIFEQNSNLRNDKDWLNFFETDIDKIVQQDKIVFLDITADWCATCQFNKINVLDSNTVNKAFKDNNVTLIRADWTKPSTKINLFLEKYDRFGIPFNAFFSVNFPDGILLSELLSEKDILKTINQINNE